MVKEQKKNFIVYYAILFIAIILSLFLTPDINAFVDSSYTFGAHRGSSVLYTENTIEAIQHAVEEPRYKFVEFDIQYTKDKKIVVHHDKTLFRLQHKRVKISDLTYEELLDVSVYHIPLYEEVMGIINKQKKVNIEIKSQGNFEDDKQLADWLIEDLEKRGLLQSVLVSSISKDVIAYIDETYPQIKLGQIFFILPATYLPGKFFTEKLYQNVTESGADYLLLHGINLRDYDALIELKPADKTLVFWYFDDAMYVIHPTEKKEIW